MNWDDYEAVWKRQPLPKGANADLGELRATFDARSRKLAATLRVRDFLEAGAGVLVAVAYGFIWRFLGSEAWPMGLAIALILGVTVFFARERVRARGRRPGADATLLAKLEADLAELRHQARLLRTVWAWYLLPCGLSMVIPFALIVQRVPAWSPLRDPAVIAGWGGFLLLVLGAAWGINYWSLRKQLEPRIVELEKLRADLSGSM